MYLHEIYQSDNMANQLPPIPATFLRLTHFTNHRTAELLVNGENFKAAQGLASTTDSFSNNADVWDVIQSGKTGPFSRGEFGDAVVLLDMSNKEYRMRVNHLVDGDVPNDRIVGFFDKRTNRLIPNRNYNSKQMPPSPHTRKPIRGQDSGQPPVPELPSTGSPDVW